jgi:hypothetical protein
VERDRRFSSYVVHNDDGTLREYNATLCAHGGEIVVQRPGATDWDFCMRCGKTICLHCARVMAALNGECVVYERQLLAMEQVVRMPDLDEYRRSAVLLDARGLEAKPAVTREQVLLMLHRRDPRLPRSPVLERLRASVSV